MNGVEVPCMACGRPVFWESTRTGRRLMEWYSVVPRARLHECRPVCGAWMRNVQEPCARRAGHAPGHRRRLVMDDDAKSRRGKWAAA